MTAIFPRFELDENDPDSYDFACTDESILCCLDAGTKTFFRLGESIEHQIKKHATIPPRDFHKWARICEHIIRHYTEGWADGFTHDMPYWEIWNEPDMNKDDDTNKLNWGGTKAQFLIFMRLRQSILNPDSLILRLAVLRLDLILSGQRIFCPKCREGEFPLISSHGTCTSALPSTLCSIP